MSTVKNNIKEIRIVVLEDSEFYNSVLTRTLQNYLEPLSEGKGFRYDIQSYTSVKDFIRNLKEDTDIVFMDYYLGDGVTAPEVISWVKRRCDHAKVIVVSQSSNIAVSQKSYSEGAVEFISKSKDSLSRACYIMEEIINERFD